MSRALRCAVMSLLVAVTTVAPADAGRRSVRLHEPTMVGQDIVQLSGRVRGDDRVVVQRYARGKRQWVKVKKVRAERRGFFTTTVRTTEKGRRFRARAGKAISRAYFTRSLPNSVVDECGVQPVRRNGTHWSCTLAEDFDGTELDLTVWTPQTIFTAGSATGRPCYVEDRSVIAVANGALHLRVREVDHPRLCLGALPYLPTSHVAGSVMTYRKFSQQYGRFEARIKTTATRVPGLQEAFWMWPDDRYPLPLLWPAAGEIDVVETYSQYPDLAIPYLHYTFNDNGGPIPGVNTAWNCEAHRGTWNTYTLVWGPGRIEILVNGRSCLVNTSGDPAFRRAYIIALTQAMGADSNAYDGRAPLPATMSVDYVRVWK